MSNQDFDPDAFLGSPEPSKKEGFNPDAFLAELKKPEGFNPDAYLGTAKPAVSRLDELGKTVTDIPHQTWEDATSAASAVNTALNPFSEGYRQKMDARVKDAQNRSWYDVRPALNDVLDTGKGLASIVGVPGALISGPGRSILGHGFSAITGDQYKPEDISPEDRKRGIVSGQEAADMAMMGLAPGRGGLRTAAKSAPPAAAPPVPPAEGPFGVTLSEGEATGDVAKRTSEQRLIRQEDSHAQQFFEQRNNQLSQAPLEAVPYFDDLGQTWTGSSVQAADHVTNALQQHQGALDAAVRGSEQALTSAHENIRNGLSPTNTTLAANPLEAADIVSSSVAASAERAQAAADAAYGSFRGLPGQFHPASFNKTADVIKANIAKGDDPTFINPQNTPNANTALNDLTDILGDISQARDPETGQIIPRPPVTPQLVETARKRLNSSLSSALSSSRSTGNWADVRAMRQVIDEFDGQVLKKLDTTFTGGDPRDVSSALKWARAQYADYRKTFTPQGAGDVVGLAIQKIVGRFEGQAATPEEIQSMLYGKGGLPVKVGRRLIDIFGADSPEIGAVKQGLKSYITERPPGATAWSHEQVADRIAQFTQGAGRTLTQTYLSPQEISRLKTLEGAHRQHAAAVKLAENPFEGADWQAIFRQAVNGSQRAVGQVDEALTRLGATSPGASTLRQGLFFNALQPVVGVEKWGVKQKADNLANLLQSTRNSTVYSPQHRQVIQSYVDMLRKLEVPKGMYEPSGPAVDRLKEGIERSIGQLVGYTIARHIPGTGLAMDLMGIKLGGEGASFLARRNVNKIRAQLPLVADQAQKYQKALAIYNKSQNPLSTAAVTFAGTNLSRSLTPLGINLSRIPQLQLPGISSAEPEPEPPKTPNRADGGATSDNYTTQLSPEEETAFQSWKAQNAPNDSGQDYDLRGAYKARLAPADNGHWDDTFKKPNHPTFSTFSQYAKDRPDLAGTWEGEQYIPPATAHYAEGGAPTDNPDAGNNYVTRRTAPFPEKPEGYEYIEAKGPGADTPGPASPPTVVNSPKTPTSGSIETPVDTFLARNPSPSPDTPGEAPAAGPAAGPAAPRGVVDKLLGLTGPRYQTWPEKMIRSGTTLAGDVLSGAEPDLTGLRREDFTDEPRPGGFTVAAEPQDALIQRTQDMAALAGGVSIPNAEEGALGMAGGKLLQPPKNGFKPTDVASVITELKRTGRLNPDGTVSLYHVTSSDYINPIMQEGLIPGKNKAPGQPWEAEHSGYGTYFHGDRDAALANAEQMNELVPNSARVVEARLPVNANTLRKILPDEDVSLDPTKGLDALKNGEAVAVVGTVPKQHLRLLSDTSKPGTALAALEHNTQPFYSTVENAIANAPQQKMHASQWAGWLKNQPGVKAEELSHLGLDKPESFPKQGMVTKDELLAHAKENGVKVGEVEKGNPKGEDAHERAKAILEEEYPGLARRDLSDMEWDNILDRAHTEISEGIQRHTKFAEYQLPGGENYRELVLTLPAEKGQAFTLKNDQGKLVNGSWATKKEALRVADELAGDHTVVPETRPDYLKQFGNRLTKQNPDNFHTGHWDEPNVLGHLRMNDREIPGVGKSMHLEEVQSDWAQKGRKEGFQTPDRPDPVQLERQANVLYQKLEASVGETRPGPNREVRGDAEALAEAIGYGGENALHFTPTNEQRQLALDYNAAWDKYREASTASQGVPNFPFKTTWPDLLLKRAITKAAREGKDAISWTPGEQQAARYDLSKHVDRLQYHPDTHDLIAEKNGRVLIDKKVTPEELPNTIGKDAADKLLNNPTRKTITPAYKVEDRYTHEGIVQGKTFVDEGEAKAFAKSRGQQVIELHGPQAGLPLHSLEGIDLKVGGEGMKVFYDKMLVDKANTIGKKYGAKVEWKDLSSGDPDSYLIRKYPSGEVEVTSGAGEVKTFSTETKAEAWVADQQKKVIKVPVLRLTPQLKEQALSRGMPLFSDTAKPGAALSGLEHEFKVGKHDNFEAPALTPKAAKAELARQNTSVVPIKDEGVKVYYSNRWNELTQALRAGDVPSYLQKEVDVLDRVTQKNNLSQPLTVYRGISQDIGEPLVQKGEGYRFTDPSYTATSLDPKVSLGGFSDLWGGRHYRDGWDSIKKQNREVRTTQAIMRLELPKDQQGAFIGRSEGAWATREKEFLMPRNSSFEVTNLETLRNKGRTLHVITAKPIQQEASEIPVKLDRYGLTPYQQQLVWNWKGGPDLTGSMKRFEDLRKNPQFDEVLKKLPAYAGRVYRGVGLPQSEVAKLQEGRIYSLTKHSSATTTKAYAEQFANDAGKIPVTFEIQQKSGRTIPGKYDDSGEREVVLPKGTKYQITNVSNRGDGYHVKLKER